MAVTTVEALLSALPLFEQVPEESLQRLESSLVAVKVPAREYVFRAGEAATELYVVSAGRLQVLAHDGDTVLRTIGPGAVLGELGVLTETPRSASVRAVRDSELLAIDGPQFELLLRDDSTLAISLLRSLARQLQESRGLSLPEATPAVFTVVPLVDRTRLEPFWHDLQQAFAELGSVAALDEARGLSAQRGASPGRVLSPLEATNDYVLLLAEGAKAWSAFAIRQADRLLVVADPASEPPADERLAGADLVLLEETRSAPIARWLDSLQPRAHHLVPSQTRAAATRRAVRRMTGRSLGMVFSGGGARGFAHIGVFEALVEEGFEVDRLGGCSIGSFIGAMAASGFSPTQMRDVCQDELVRRAPFSDYTFPRFALIRARRAAGMLQRVFGDARLEDLSPTLFTVSADLISSELVVHRRGPVWEAVGSSMAIPGLAPPHSYGRHLLVDGGVLNNLPVDLMAEVPEGPVVAVDVIRRSPAADRPGTPSLPTILETLSRATVLGSARLSERNRHLAALTIVPDVQAIALRDFSQLNRAIEAGKAAAVEALENGGRDGLQAALGGAT